MKVRYCKTKKQKNHVKELQEIVFCKSERIDPYTENTHWWIMYEEEKPVAFAGVKTIGDKDNVFLCLSGVHPSSRGKGLQRNLIRVREQWAKRNGYKVVFTFTILENPASSNNLINCGYKVYEPDYAWKGRFALYWRKELNQ